MSQCFPCARRENEWGSGGITPLILNLVLVGGEMSAPHRGRFTPGEGSYDARYRSEQLGEEKHSTVHRLSSL